MLLAGPAGCSPRGCRRCLASRRRNVAGQRHLTRSDLYAELVTWASRSNRLRTRLVQLEAPWSID